MFVYISQHLKNTGFSHYIFDKKNAGVNQRFLI